MRGSGRDGKILTGLFACTLFVIAGTGLFRTGREWSTLGPIKREVILGICAFLLWLGAEHAAPLFPRIQELTLTTRMREVGGLIIIVLGIEYFFIWKGAAGDWLFWVQIGLGVVLLVAPIFASKAR